MESFDFVLVLDFGLHFYDFHSFMLTASPDLLFAV